MLKRTTPVARKVVSNFLREPAEHRTYQQTLEQCQATNIDMASQLSSDFLHVQSRLLSYRVARLATECRFIAANPLGALPGVRSLLFHCLALPAVFAGCYWAGRGSTWPLMAAPVEAAEAVPAEAEATEGTDHKGNAIA